MQLQAAQEEALAASATAMGKQVTNVAEGRATAAGPGKKKPQQGQGHNHTNTKKKATKK
jgi:hypothetical protein